MEMKWRKRGGGGEREREGVMEGNEMAGWLNGCAMLVRLSMLLSRIFASAVQSHSHTKSHILCALHFAIIAHHT